MNSGLGNKFINVLKALFDTIPFQNSFELYF